MVFYKSYLDDPAVDGSERINFSENVLTFEYPCPHSVKCSPYVVTLNPGRYKFEVWGAQGGGNNTGIKGVTEGGKGGYSVGKLLLDKQTTFYLYIGSSGINGGNGGYNGGGALGSSIWVNDPNNNNRAPGGGATDIRLKKGIQTIIKTIDFEITYYGLQDSLESRVIVAGGGGGYNPENGFGGGTEGAHTNLTYATSGNQTHPGKTSTGEDAGFGYGGFTRLKGEGISGGGAGYYGGGGSTYALGGSGYYNKSFFYVGSTLAGDTRFPSPFNTFENGHSGDGAARITHLICMSDSSKKSIKFFIHLIPFVFIRK